MGWKVHLVDLVGLALCMGANVLILAAAAYAMIGLLRGSWFTDKLWRLPRGPESVYEILVWTLGFSLVGWAAAWERLDWEAWKWQIGLTITTWILTVFHLIGVVLLYL